MNIETLHSSHKTKAVLSYDDYMKQAKEALVNKEYANASSLIEAADQKYTDIESGKIVEHSLPLVYAYVMQGKLTEALSTIERVISCYRVFPFTFDYFCILSRMGKLEEALHMLAEIESENAEDIGILTMVYSCRCLVYFSLGKIEEGHTAYEKFDETFRARFWNFDKIPEYHAMKELDRMLTMVPQAYSVVLSDELPPPAEWSKKNPEKVSYTINVYYKIIKNADGNIVYSGSMGL